MLSCRRLTLEGTLGTFHIFSGNVGKSSATLKGWQRWDQTVGPSCLLMLDFSGQSNLRLTFQKGGLTFQMGRLVHAWGVRGLWKWWVLRSFHLPPGFLAAFGFPSAWSHPQGPSLTSLSLFFAANDGRLQGWLSGRVMVLEDNIQFINIGFYSSPLLPPL